jgi:Tol biopolymer transport system component
MESFAVGPRGGQRPPIRLIASTHSDSAAQYSADGKRIAFEPERGGVRGIWVSDANGSNAVLLFSGAHARSGTARWSPDGQRIAFDSNIEGNYTRNGGCVAFESFDSQSVYYTKGDFRTPTGLWKMPVSGSEESQVLPSVVSRAFSLVKEGIYFISEPGADRKSSIQFLSFATAKVKTVAPISGFPEEGLSVSPDGRSLLFSRLDEAGSDLMLVENFR